MIALEHIWKTFILKLNSVNKKDIVHDVTNNYKIVNSIRCNSSFFEICEANGVEVDYLNYYLRVLNDTIYLGINEKV
jgi:hypothetical protein